jgi:hypothetical protein
MQQRDAVSAPQAEAICPPDNSPFGRHWRRFGGARAETYSAWI